MSALVPPIEMQRKQPVQTRSAVTVEAVLDATLQVLIRVGKEKLTTTLVAARAGVSVGTLYQYFPNKRSLLQALLRRTLTRATEAVEQASALHRGEPLEQAITAVANAFFRAKMSEPVGSVALYSVSSDVDGLRITEDLRLRTVAAFEAMLAAAPETLSVELRFVAFTMQASMNGIARRILETEVPACDHELLREQMIRILCAYARGVTQPG